MRVFAICAVLGVVGCSGGDDAGVSSVDTGTFVDSESLADSGASTDSLATAETSSDASTDSSSETGVTPSCSDYCSKIAASCVGANAQYAVVGDGAAAVCAAMCPVLAVGSTADTTGDTLGCRMHFAAAATTSPDGNCAPAGAYGGGTCGNRCAVFCKLAVARCAGLAATPFSSEADCNTKCADQVKTFDTTKSEIDTTPNTFNCMQYHLQAAYSSSVAAMSHFHCGLLTLGSGPCKL